VCLVATGALYLSGISGGLLVASGKGGIRRGFSILEFPPRLRDTLRVDFGLSKWGSSSKYWAPKSSGMGVLVCIRYLRAFTASELNTTYSVI
jgi:hypothetical protein